MDIMNDEDKCSSSEKNKNNNTTTNSINNMETQENCKQNLMARIQGWWNDQVMDYFSKANLFVTCCIAAALLLIAYLAAFSCEVSWLLESRGELPTSAYLLCAGYFIMFVATTILIHGLVTGLSWGLFSWSIIVGLLSIPELAFVMIMTTQHWGLQSTHGLTELISYLIRLVINCLTLLCVIPTALKWRRETQVLTQLQMLATRLQHQTPPPSVPMSKCESHRSSKKRRHSKSSNAFDNPGFLVNENDTMITPVIGGVGGLLPPPQSGSTSSFYGGRYGSHNEFNASIFGLNPSQYFGPYLPPQSAMNAKKAQSLLDLRYAYANGNYPNKDQIDNFKITSSKNLGNNNNNNFDQIKNINEKKKNIEDLSVIGGDSSINDPIYCTIDNKSPKLSRNCISLENLEGITKIKNDLSYGNNLLQNHHYWYNMLGYPEFLNQQQQNQQHHLNHHQLHHHPSHHMLHSGHFSQLYHHRVHPYPFPHHPLQYYNYGSTPLQIIGSGGIGYGGYTNPYANKSNTNSKQSIGTDSDDYRKYRDVAL